jgi:flavin reductase (DIM6/NTAB) family NADH-FMN oxidoreductase RutF
MTVSIDTFRSVMSHWPSGITVVTARHGEQVHGMVASSFCSVSTDPATVLVCADHRTRTYPLIKASGVFAVNLLSEEQEDTFRVFAGWLEERADDKFTGEDTITAVTGAPILRQSLGWLDCRVAAAYPGGNTHTIFIGEVLAAAQGDGVGVPPLVYYHRKVRHLVLDGSPDE